MSNNEAEDQQVQLHDPRIPAGVRRAVSAFVQPGASLWRCPRTAVRKGLFGFGQPSVVIEWWLLDQHGDLIEAFFET